MSELVRMNVEIQCADDLGVQRGCPEIGRIINRAVLDHLKQALETAFGKRLLIFHVQHIKALCALALLYKLRKQRGRYRNIWTLLHWDFNIEFPIDEALANPKPGKFDF